MKLFYFTNFIKLFYHQKIFILQIFKKFYFIIYETILFYKLLKNFILQIIKLNY
jgi:hypothetical protein